MKVVFIDNFDSFTYNLVEYVSDQRLPDGDRPETTVLRNTASIDDVEAEAPDAIVISPGPGHPKNDRDVGISGEVLTTLSKDVPTLGVCLGMEAAVYEYGGRVGPAPSPVHGKSSAVRHDGEGIFEGIRQGFPGGRYHSLASLEVPESFEVSATIADASVTIPMAVRHRNAPIVGVQFHPESVLTAVGHDLIENFLTLASAAPRP